MGDYQEVLVIAEAVIKESQDQDLGLPRLDVLIQQSEAYWRTGNFVQHLVTLHLGEQLLQKLDKLSKKAYAKRKALLLLLKVGVPYVKGEYSLALEYCKQALSFAKRCDNKQLIAQITIVLGDNFRLQMKYKN